MRVAVVDIGTNSTRLLVADVERDGALVELERRAKVTRLGDRVDETGVLDEGAMERVLTTLAEYCALIEAHRAQRTVAVLTSAVRDAANGEAFLARVRAHEGAALDARVIAGDEEARLTFRGATSERAPDDATPTLVIDVGGGSTELVVGSGDEVSFHVSTQAGVVRHTERHLHTDPPTRSELEALAADVRSVFEQAVPTEARETACTAISVAGTATSLGAIDLDLECHSANKVHGHVVSVATCRRILERLAGLPESQRRAVRGLHPDRAPTIVAGVVMVIEALQLFGLDATGVSDHDILRGAALEVVHQGRPSGAPAPGTWARSPPTDQ
jgi:exopolyphosphatase / guanosine-5'-triphosphate,3'-diphosphate pyrophosphatase